MPRGTVQDKSKQTLWHTNELNMQSHYKFHICYAPFSMIGYYSTWSSTDRDSFNQLMMKISFERISICFFIFSLIFTFNHYLYTAKIHQVIYTGTISLAIISQASQWCKILKPRILTQPSSGGKHIYSCGHQARLFQHKLLQDWRKVWLDFARKPIYLIFFSFSFDCD